MSRRRTVGAIREELEWLGHDKPPPPRRAFVGDLEARLRAIATEPMPPVAPEPRPEPSSRGRLSVAAVAAAATIVIAGFVVARPSTRGDVHATAGVPAAVDAGAAAESPDSSSPNGIHAGGGDSGVTSSSAAPGRSASPAAGAAPAADGEAFDDALVAAPEDTAERPVLAFDLRGSGTPARVFLDWDRFEGEDFAAYLVLRSIAPADPHYPDHDGTLVMRRIESRDSTSFDDTPKIGSTTRWRVVVVDAGGGVIGRSNVVTPTDTPASPRSPIVWRPPAPVRTI